MDPSDCFLSLKEMTFVLLLKLLAVLATLRLALFRPLMSLKLWLEVELVLDDDFDSVFNLRGSETLRTFLFGTEYNLEGSGRRFFLGDSLLA